MRVYSRQSYLPSDILSMREGAARVERRTSKNRQQNITFLFLCKIAGGEWEASRIGLMTLNIKCVVYIGPIYICTCTSLHRIFIIHFIYFFSHLENHFFTVVYETLYTCIGTCNV